MRLKRVEKTHCALPTLTRANRLHYSCVNAIDYLVRVVECIICLVKSCVIMNTRGR